MTKPLLFVALMTSLPANTLTAADAAIAPPVARKIPKTDVVHGERREDDYFWLRDKANPEVAAYLEAENAYTDAVMKPTEAFQEALYKEMLGAHQGDGRQVPYRKGGYLYYSRTEEGKQYPIYCRKQGSLDAPEEVMLDLNALAEGKKFMALGAYAVSDDGKLLAYSTDDTGFRAVHALRQGPAHRRDCCPIRSREGGRRSPGPPTTRRSSTRRGRAAKRPYRLYRHLLGDGGADDLVYEEKRRAVQHRRRPHAQPRSTWSWACGSHTTAEVRVPAGRPADRRVADGGAAHARPGVRRRPPRRRVLHPHQRHGPQLPPGQGAGGDAAAARTGGGDPAPRRT